VTETKKKKGSSQPIELKEGVKFSGQIMSIKNQQMYVQIPSASKTKGVMSIGRLHLVECQSSVDFNQYSVGDRIEAKILQVVYDKTHDRTWIELTRREEHMQKVQGLDEATVKNTPKSVEDLVSGKQYEAVLMGTSPQDSVKAVNLNSSQPLHI